MAPVVRRGGMTQRVTFNILDRPDGRFDLIVLLGSQSLYACEGFLTLAEAEDEMEFLRGLMTECGAPIVRETDILVR